MKSEERRAINNEKWKMNNDEPCEGSKNLRKGWLVSMKLNLTKNINKVKKHLEVINEKEEFI